MDTYVVSTGKSSIPYTRMRAPFINLNNFYFKVYRSGFLSEIGKKLGMEDIKIGYEKFDRDFIIKGNDKGKVKQLFANESIRKLIQNQPHINLQIKNDEGFFKEHFPDGGSELYFEVPDVIKDINRLKKLYELFAEVLKELESIGVAGGKELGIML